MSGLLKLSFAQCYCSHDIYRHTEGLARKQKRLRSVRLPWLKVRNALLAYIEKKHPFPGLLVDFAKNKQTAQLSGPFTEDGPRGMM